MNNKIVSVKGMNDILPHQSYKWLWLENKLQKWITSYDYKNIRTPIVEQKALFIRSIGEVTDIVEKEMYTFTDLLNGDDLALRPEGTAGVVRSVVEHNLLYGQTQKLWYIGPMFRHERPQKGRYRQFHQFGAEAIGFNNINIEIEIILMIEALWTELKLNNLELQINCIGNTLEREIYKAGLTSYFENNIDILDTSAKNRLYTNPLRILDTKNPAMLDLVRSAPKLINCLGNESLNNYNNLKQNLQKLNISFTENPFLVRGLDYYNGVVFEWLSKCLGSQSTLCAGGRYDNLITNFGSEKNSAIGFAIGLERLILVLDSINIIPQPALPQIFIASNTQSYYIFMIATLLRAEGFIVLQNLNDLSLKSQLKKAVDSQAQITLIIGDDEINTDQVMVKFMHERTQNLIHKSNLIESIKKYFQEKDNDSTRLV